MEFYNLKKQEVLEKLHTSNKGLGKDEANRRLKKYGHNELKKTEKLSVIKIFANQFTDLLILILIAAAVISFLLGQVLDAVVIGAILLLNAILGFVQEFKAERSLALLKKLSAIKSRVVRAGRKIIIDSNDLVPGDILLLETGDKITADARLLEVYELQTDESTLTGESTSVIKQVKPLSGKITLAEQVNMVFRGTIITAGRGIAVVTSTGMDTSLGKVAKLVQTAKEEKTPLELRLRKLGVVLGIIVVAISLLILIVGLLEHIDFLTAFLTSVSLAVSAIPEGLPAVVTICLAIGVQKMLKKNALIRRLRAVETLGSTQIICADKTGTMTKNEMEVKKIFVNNKLIDANEAFYFNKKKIDSKNFELILDIGASCNDSELEIGDPTEIALLKVAKKAKINKREDRIHEIPFSSERKYMTTTHIIGGEEITYIKGAPEKVLELCKYINQNGRERRMIATDFDVLLKQNEEMANEALRVIGMAYKKNSKTVFVGLMGMIDPPRKEVKNSIKLCEEAGIRVVMITGDHKLTAQAIAKQVGIDGNVVTGKELDKMSDGELSKIVDNVNIYARVDPAHKVRILEMLQKKGNVVAMTGDGVNDAPALKKADVGIAMNIKGTDVSRDAADMVLMDDNFATIVSAVREGRVIYDNIKKFVKFLLSANFDEILLILITLLFKLPLPLLPLQILWINLITDGFPALALSIDHPERNIMQRKPRNKKEGILKGIIPYIIGAGLLAAAVSLIGYFKFYNLDLDKARTMVLTISVMFEMFWVFSCRSAKSTIFELKSNNWLYLAVLFGILLHMGMMYTPLASLFKVVPLNGIEWLMVIGLSCVGFVVFEGLKLIRKVYVR